MNSSTAVTAGGPERTRKLASTTSCAEALDVPKLQI